MENTSEDSLSKLLLDLESDRIEKRTATAKTFDALPCWGSTLEELNINLLRMNIYQLLLTKKR
jgi:hypothetical protein